MRYLSTLTAALTGRQVDSKITVDDLRIELCEAGQIPAAALGPTFGVAVEKGYLIATTETRKTTWRPGKGRLIRVYKITSRARQEAREKAPA